MFVSHNAQNPSDVSKLRPKNATQVDLHQRTEATSRGWTLSELGEKVWPRRWGPRFEDMNRMNRFACWNLKVPISGQILVAENTTDFPPKR